MSPQNIDAFAPQPINQALHQTRTYELDRAFWFAEEPSPFTLDLSRHVGCTGRQPVRLAGKRLGRHTGQAWRMENRAAFAHEQGRRCTTFARREDAHRDDAQYEEKSRQLIELTEKNRQLQELNRVCAAYIADVAHELRNSLLTLNFYVGLLANGRPEKQEYYQRLALRSVEQLRQFVEDTLSLSRLDLAATSPAEMHPVDLNDVVRDVVLLHQPQAEAAGLLLSFEPTVNAATVLGDSLLLSHVVINLVTNAIKYTQAGWIVVRTEVVPATNGVVVEVVDSGIGIAPNDLRYIFERFYRAQDEQIEMIPGTGLGLAIVKEIVHQHQGEIAVESTVGVGSRFRVSLPALGEV